MADPLYRRIANDLRVQIETGQLKPGSQLPPEEKLGQLFDASRNTIRGAIKFLISLALVETRAGQGTFVVDPPDPLVTTLTTKHPGLGGGEGAAYLTEANERHPRSTVPTVELQSALGEIAYRLGVPDGTPVVSRHERRFMQSKRPGQPGGRDTAEADGFEGEQSVTRRRGETPWSMQTSFYPSTGSSSSSMSAKSQLRSSSPRSGPHDTVPVDQLGHADQSPMESPSDASFDHRAQARQRRCLPRGHIRSASGNRATVPPVGCGGHARRGRQPRPLRRSAPSRGECGLG